MYINISTNSIISFEHNNESSFEHQFIKFFYLFHQFHSSFVICGIYSLNMSNHTVPNSDHLLEKAENYYAAEWVGL